MMPVLIWLMGASIFSFLNVMIYRMPRKISFVRGRSFCPRCGASLSWYDTIPVFGWVMLRGRCRHCGDKISLRYPLMEVLGGSVILVCLWKYGVSVKGLLVFLFLAILTVVGGIDWDTMEIPNELSLMLVFLGIADTLLAGGTPLTERVVGIVSVSLPLLLITIAIPGAFGGGDIKLMAAAGIFLGWKWSLLAAFLAIVTGGVYGIWLLATKKIERKGHFAFGPFLCGGMAVAVLAGGEILNWYLGFFV